MITWSGTKHHADAAFYFQRAPRIACVLAVGAKETIKAAGLDAEVQFIDGAELPEIARQVGGLDGGIHGAGNGRKLSGAGRWSNRKENQAAGRGIKTSTRLDRGVVADLPA